MDQNRSKNVITALTHPSRSAAVVTASCEAVFPMEKAAPLVRD